MWFQLFGLRILQYTIIYSISQYIFVLELKILLNLLKYPIDRAKSIS